MVGVIRNNSINTKIEKGRKVSNKVYFFKRQRFTLEKTIQAFNVAQGYVNTSSLDTEYKKAFNDISKRINWTMNLKLTTESTTNEDVLHFCNWVEGLSEDYKESESIGELEIKLVVLDSSCISYKSDNGKDYVLVQFTDELAKQFEDYCCVLVYEGEDEVKEFIYSYVDILVMLYDFKSDYKSSDYTYKFTECGLHFDTLCMFNSLLHEYVYLINCSSFEKGELQWYDKDHIIVPIKAFDLTVRRLPIHLRALEQRNG